MVLVKNWPFFYRFLLGNIDQENVLSDILEEKKRFSKLSKQEFEKVEKFRFFRRG